MEYQTVTPQTTPHLYKFMAYRHNYLKSLLQDNIIFFQERTKFNDPWDCSIQYHRSIYSSPLERQNLENKLLNIAANKGHNPFDEPWASRIKTITSSHENVLAFLDKIEDDSDTLSDLWLIYSMSETWNSLPMWGYYADSHKGICIEFKSSLHPFSKAIPVDYDTKPHKVILHHDDPHHKFKPLLTKSTQWEHEREYRILDNTIDNFLEKDGQLVKIDDSAINSIIIGYRSENEKEILNTIQTYKPSITVKKVIKKIDTYDMDLKIISS